MGRAVSGLDNSSSILTKMKLLWVLIVVAALVAADDDDDDDDTQDGGVDNNVDEAVIVDEAIVSTNSSTGGRSRSRPNRRFFGGLGNVIGQAGAALLTGALQGGRPVRPHNSHHGFGGGRPNRPHNNHGFGGGRPNRPHNNHNHHGFGGGRPVVQPGFGGGNQGFGGQVTGGCRYWCRTPQGQAYCCENSNQAASLPFTKPGQCPPVRPSCPPTRNFGRPPQTCSNDSRCPGVDKCCFDTCLQEHVCKPPLGIGK